MLSGGDDSALPEMFPGAGGGAEPAGIGTSRRLENWDFAAVRGVDSLPDCGQELIPIRTFAEAEASADHDAFRIKQIDQQCYLATEHFCRHGDYLLGNRVPRDGGRGDFFGFPSASAVGDEMFQ